MTIKREFGNYYTRRGYRANTKKTIYGVYDKSGGLVVIVKGTVKSVKVSKDLVSVKMKYKYGLEQLVQYKETDFWSEDVYFDE